MKKTYFNFEGKKYELLGVLSGESEGEHWEEKITNTERIREIFAYRPWWVGHKFRWLKKIKVKERLIICRYTSFDDGWTYQNYWGPWVAEWEAIEIID